MFVRRANALSRMADATARFLKGPVEQGIERGPVGEIPDSGGYPCIGVGDRVRLDLGRRREQVKLGG